MSFSSWIRAKFKKTEAPVVKDYLQEIKLLEEATPPSPQAKTSLSISKIPALKNPAYSYGQSRNIWSGSEYKGCEYNLVEVGLVEDVESWVHQAFTKKIGLMFKEGYDFVGKNKEAIQYINIRLAQIARASNLPTILLLQRVALSLIRTSNAFLIKVRDSKASGGRVRTTPGGRSLKPVAAYFPAAAETMQVKLNADTGKIEGWKQVLPDGRFQDYRPEDVIHFVSNKREGFVFGTPDIIPVLDDIRALRQIEENVELLLYQHLFPLFHYKVGTENRPAGYAENGRKEVDIVKEEIQYMPGEGGIVTPERHEIKMIGAEGRALRAESYLDYFKRRIIAGLGISTIDLGDAATANRASARTLSRQLIDAIKALQDLFEAQFDQEIISELLLESTFEEDVLEANNMVHLQFAEIDLENRMDYEKHMGEVFKNQGLTYDEYRRALGKEPILLPEDPSDQDPTSYPEWHSTYWKLFEEPALIIRAIDEAFTPGAKAAAEARSLQVTAPQVAQSAQEQKQLQKPTKDSLGQEYQNLKKDLLISLQEKPGVDTIRMLVNLWSIHVGDKLFRSCYLSYIQGVQKVAPRHPSYALLIQEGKVSIEYRSKYYVNKLARDLEKNLLKGEDSVMYIFDALEYRINYIMDVEPRKAANYGYLVGRRVFGETQVSCKLQQDACELCKQKQVISLQSLSLDNVFPHHPRCKCEVE